MYIGNKSLGETVTAFALVGLLEAPTLVTIDDERTFAGACLKIHLPTTKVLLYIAVSDISKSKKLRDWSALNDVLLPPFLAEVVVLKEEMAAGELPKTITGKILERVSKSTVK